MFAAGLKKIKQTRIKDLLINKNRKIFFCTVMFWIRARLAESNEVWIRTESRTRFVMTKIWKINWTIFFISQTAYKNFLRSFKRLSRLYWRSPQASQRALQTWNLYIFPFLRTTISCRPVAASTESIEIGSNPYLDPKSQHWLPTWINWVGYISVCLVWFVFCHFG